MNPVIPEVPTVVDSDHLLYNHRVFVPWTANSTLSSPPPPPPPKPGLWDWIVGNQKKILAVLGTILLGLDGFLRAYPDMLGGMLKNRETALFISGIVTWGATHWVPPSKTTLAEATTATPAPSMSIAPQSALSSPLAPRDKV